MYSITMVLDAFSYAKQLVEVGGGIEGSGCRIERQAVSWRNGDLPVTQDNILEVFRTIKIH